MNIDYILCESQEQYTFPRQRSKLLILRKFKQVHTTRIHFTFFALQEGKLTGSTSEGKIKSKFTDYLTLHTVSFYFVFAFYELFGDNLGRISYRSTD